MMYFIDTQEKDMSNIKNINIPYHKSRELNLLASKLLDLYNEKCQCYALALEASNMATAAAVVGNESQMMALHAHMEGHLEEIEQISEAMNLLADEVDSLVEQAK